MTRRSDAPRTAVTRVQTGVRIERRVLGMLKAIADLRGLTLGDLIEGMALHAFEGRAPFGQETLERIRALRTAFALDLTAADSHLLQETSPARSTAPRRKRPAGG